MIRRTITLVLMGLAFYAGIKVERGLTEQGCRGAGGEIVNGVCIGARDR